MNDQTSLESQELFNLIVENVEDFAIFATDVEGHIVSWNPGVERLLGYREAEWVGQHSSVVFTPEDLERGADRREMETAAGEGRAQDKRWHVRKDGSHFWANGMLMPLRDDAGDLRGFAKIMRDDTERGLAEKEREGLLRELVTERSRLEQILQQIPAGVSIVEAPTGKRLFSNEEAERLLGHPITLEDDYRDYGRYGALHPDGRSYEPDEYPTVRALLRGETVKGEEMLYRRGDASLITLSVNSTPIRDAEGRVIAAASIFTDITRRRRTEAERERFFALGSDLLVVAGFDGYFKWVSPAWERTFGWTASELTAHPWLHFVHPEDQERTIKEAEQLFEGHETVLFENRYRRKDGSYRWISWNTKSYPQEQLLYSAATDITERKEAEETLRESEERLRLALEAGRLGTWRYDPATDLVELDERMRDIWGLASAAAVSLPEVLGRIHPDDRERVAEAVAAALDPRSPEGYALDYRIVLPGGEERWVAANGRAQFEGEGEARHPAGFIGTGLDITRRKRAEDALRQREEQFRTLADSIPQLAWMAEADGHIFWYNRRWYDYTGTTLEEMEGWGWQKVHDPEVLPQVVERWGESIRTGEAFEMSFPLRGVNGVFRRFLTRVLPLHDAEGRVVRWFGTNTDIEEQLRAEETLKEANRLKDEFLATLSHELRTPLTAILGWANMLGAGQLDENTVARALDTIQRNARSQVQLIDDLLDVSRIITGKLRLDVRPVELSQVIEASVDSVRPAAEAKNIRLQVLLDPQAGLVSGDADRLQQVVWNLLTNAVKFTPKGGRVQVRLERVNSHVEVTVSDTGGGIGQEFLPHVFDRFRQADQTTTRAHGGLGLGLSIVRQLVELHGGSVRAESEGEGRGATFIVELPLLVSRRPLEMPQRRHPTAGSAGVFDCPPQLTGLRVLVVDDEEDARELLSAVLGQCGSEVMTAGSAAEALELFSRSKPDVLVSDIGMPEEDGYELIGKVRALETKKGRGRIPAIALTAYARVEDRVRALNAGFQVHVPKPIEPVELVAVVASLAGRTGVS